MRTELGYKVDTPYKIFAYEEPGFQKWDWGDADKGFPNTGPGLREALTKNPYLKVLVMEGYYDLATPYAAANYTFDHLDCRRTIAKIFRMRRMSRAHGVRRPTVGREDEEGSGGLYGTVGGELVSLHPSAVREDKYCLHFNAE